jgi:hypothetical protein
MPLQAGQGSSVDSNAGNTGATGGGLGGMAEAVTSMASITKGIAGVVEGIFQVVTKLFTAIIDASPLLSGVLKIIDKMFRLVLMPIGNIIGRLLLPIVMQMAKKTMNLLSKYANAGPEQIGDMLTEGLTIAIESITDMLSIVLTKVLWPVLTALGQSILNGIAHILSGGLLGNEMTVQPDTTTQLTNLFGDSLTDLTSTAQGFGNVINTFGLTIQTGNRIAGNGFSELATAFYSGNADIANGFQSVHNVLVVGSTKAIETFAGEFNTSSAGLVTTIDTTKIAFGELITKVNDFAEALVTNRSGDYRQPPATKTETNWLGVLATAIAGPISLVGAAVNQLTDKSGHGFENFYRNVLTTQVPIAGGGIVTRPTNALIGEAGPEAIIPLSKYGSTGGQSINVHFHGDVYGMDDFERKVENTVSRYSGRVRGAI